MNTWFLRFIGVSVFALSFLAGLIVYQSFILNSLPITFIDITYTGKRAGDFVIITSSTTAKVSNDVTAKVNRVLKHEKNGFQIELQNSDIKYTEGLYDATRVFYAPDSIPNGRYCVETMIDWRPMFSLTEKTTVVKQGCFDLNG